MDKEVITGEIPHGGLIDIAELLLVLGWGKNKSEAKRLIEQGAVEINNEKVGRFAVITDDFILRCGKLRVTRVKMPRIKVTAEVKGNGAKILDIEGT